MTKYVRRVLVLVLVSAMLLSGCGKDANSGGEQQVSHLHNFSGRVERVADGSILVEPAAGSDMFQTASLIWVYSDVNNIRVGDWVQVSYDGTIQETYPAQIPNVYGVAMEKRVLTDELQDEILAELSWEQAEFFDFKQINGVAFVGCQNGEEIGFVVLQKGDSDYSLVEAHKQTEAGFQVFDGVMDSCQVYLVTDPDIYGLKPINENYDEIAIYNFPALIVPWVDTEFEPLRNE